MVTGALAGHAVGDATRSSGLPPASWPVLHPLAPKGIWEGTWRTASGEQSCSQGRSSLLPCSCSLPPPHVLRPVPPRPTCVQSFHSWPFVAPLWGGKCGTGVHLHGASVLSLRGGGSTLHLRLRTRGVLNYVLKPCSSNKKMWCIKGSWTVLCVPK